MCGISALFSPNQRPLAQLIQQMTNLIRHRGPDDEGYALIGDGKKAYFLGGKETVEDCYLDKIPQRPSGHIEAFYKSCSNVAVGHRRLSIIDLSSAGHQPIMSSDKRYIMVYNGEVYNYLELRKELETLGHVFHSQTDTEVVLAAYLQWGKESLSYFNGMFALVIYDTHKERLFAARDRFGIKPLYYWISPQGILAFASEIKQFTCLPGWQAKMNPQRSYDFLNWGTCDHYDETLFEGVRQLLGGQFVELSYKNLKKELPVKQWYRLQAYETELSFSEASQHFYELFKNSIQLRLRSDVPVGTGLSGGLDSSSIVCVVNEELQRKKHKSLQNSFSACAEDSRFDERQFINEVVKKTGIKAYYTFPKIDQLFDSLETLTWHQDEPFSSTSIFAEWEVFKLVAKTPVKVTLDGHGADEMLIGYHSFFGAFWAGLLKNGCWGQLSKEIYLARKLHGYNFYYCVKKIIDMMLSDQLRQRLRSVIGKSSSHPEWLDCERFAISGRDPVELLGGRDIDINTQSRASIINTSIPIQLHWADRDSMAHSIESRVPFLDYRIVEFVLGCPTFYKLKNGITKRMLRSGLGKVLPNKISGRIDKMGFVTPEEIWVRQQNPEIFRRALRRAVDRSGGLLNDRAVILGDKIIDGALPFNTVLWRMISFGVWLEKFSVRV